MKIIAMATAFLALLLVVAFSSYAGTLEGRWDGTDKFEHAGASFVIGVIVAQDDFFDSKIASFAIAMTPGVVKEVWFDDRASAKDLVADAVGAYLGVSLIKGFGFTSTGKSTVITWRKEF